jgi:hypothetical protein
MDLSHRSIVVLSSTRGWIQCISAAGLTAVKGPEGQCPDTEASTAVADSTDIATLGAPSEYV